MRAQGRIEFGIGEQHVARIIGVAPLSGQPVKQPGTVYRPVVPLVLLMGVTPTRILWHRHVDARFDRAVDFRASSHHLRYSKTGCSEQQRQSLHRALSTTLPCIVT